MSIQDIEFLSFVIGFAAGVVLMGVFCICTVVKELRK